MKKSEIIFGALRVPIDYLVTVAAFLIAYYIRPITDLIPGVQYQFGAKLLPDFKEYILLAIFSSLFLVIIFAINHLYSLKVTQKFSGSLFKIIFLVTAWMMFIIAYYFLIVHQLFFSRIALVHIWIFTVIFIIIGRMIIQFIQSVFLRFGIGKRKVLFIGVSSVADAFYSFIKKNPSYEVVGALDDTVVSRKIDKLKIIGTLNQLENIVKKYSIEEIIQADPNVKEIDSSDLHAFCRNNQIKYHFIPDLLKLQRANVDVQMVGNIPLVSLKETSLDGWGQIFKRIFDIGFSSLAIILLIPLWIIVGILIKADSKGPIFYKSQRKYRDNFFGVYKFRSMVANADEQKKELMEYNERTGPMFKIKNDPRITRIGCFLRKTSIDELPQLFNVLIGYMSLVGPRPHLPEEINQYKSHHYQVFALKPGITGLAQISGRSNLDFEDEVKLDVYYIENWSPWLDLKILLKTISVVFRADGA